MLENIQNKARSLARSESPSELNSFLDHYSGFDSFPIHSSHHSRSGLHSRHSSIGNPSIGIRALGPRPNSRKSSRMLLANVPGIRPVNHNESSFSNLRNHDLIPSIRASQINHNQLRSSIMPNAGIQSNSVTNSPTRRLSVFIKNLKQSSLVSLANRKTSNLTQE